MSSSVIRRRAREAFYALAVCLLAGSWGCLSSTSPPAIVRIDPPASPGSVTPHLTAAGETILLSWFEPEGDAGRGTLRYSRLEHHGGTWRWNAPRRITSSTSFFVNWADFPSIQQGGDGSLLVHWLEMMGSGKYAYGIQLALSQDEGGSWRGLGMPHDDRAQVEHGFVSVVPERSGFRAFWLDGRETGAHAEGGAGGSTMLRTARVDDRPGADEEIDGRVCDCCQTGAVMTAEGPVVVYRDRSDGEIRDISIVRWTGDGWTSPAPVAADSWRVPGCPVNGPAIAVDSTGRRLAVAWFTASFDRPRVQVAFSEDAGATFSMPIVVDRGEPLGRTAVAIDPAGDAIVAWTGSGNDQSAPLFACRVSFAGGAARRSERLLVSTGPGSRAAGFPRIAMAGESALVAWTEPGEAGGVRAAQVPAALMTLERVVASRPAPTPGKARAWDGLPGSMAPAFEAVDLEGRPYLLASQRGHPVLLNVWATWCGPCKEELPMLSSLHAAHGPSGLHVVGVSVDGAGSRARVVEMVSDAHLTYRIVLDPEDRASSLFRLSMLPATFLFDADGVLVWRREGVIEPDDPGMAAALARVIDTTADPRQ
ncbi:MAG: redoxin domain-containing protein [Candidatus Polarisedimenticolia bacterium]